MGLPCEIRLTGSGHMGPTDRLNEESRPFASWLSAYDLLWRCSKVSKVRPSFRSGAISICTLGHFGTPHFYSTASVCLRRLAAQAMTWQQGMAIGGIVWRDCHVPEVGPIQG